MHREGERPASATEPQRRRTIEAVERSGAAKAQRWLARAERGGTGSWVNAAGLMPRPWVHHGALSAHPLRARLDEHALAGGRRWPDRPRTATTTSSTEASGGLAGLPGAVTGTLAGAPPSTTDQRLLVTAHGPVVATGSAGATAWRPDGRLLWTRHLPRSACTRVASQGSELLCGGVAGHVVGLDLMTGRSTATDLDGQHGAVRAVVAAADGVTVVVLSGTEPVRTRWRLDGTGPVTRRLALPAPLGTWSPDGRWLLLGGTPGSASAEPPVVVDARSGGIMAVLRGAAVAVWGRSGDELVTWTDSGLAQVAPLAAAPVGRLDGGFGEVPVGVQVIGRGDPRRLVAWESGGPGVEVWQPGTGQFWLRAAFRDLSRPC